MPQSQGERVYIPVEYRFTGVSRNASIFECDDLIELAWISTFFIPRR